MKGICLIGTCLLVLTIAGSVLPLSSDDYAEGQFAVAPMVSAGGFHTVGLNCDGTVIAVGANQEGQTNFNSDDWRLGIRQVSAGVSHTVGVIGLSVGNSPVAATGDHCIATGGWREIMQLSAGTGYTVGLKLDYTVVSEGLDQATRFVLEQWRDIKQVSAGGYHIVGLKLDGTVVAVGNNDYGQCDVQAWADIKQVSAGRYHTVGLKNDGTVVAIGDNSYGQCNVAGLIAMISGWQDIKQVSAGWYHTVGLKNDGTVVAIGDNSYGQCNVRMCTTFFPFGSRFCRYISWFNPFGTWQGITQVSAGAYHTVGLKSNGRVVAIGDNSCGQCNVMGWNLACLVEPQWTYVFTDLQGLIELRINKWARTFQFLDYMSGYDSGVIHVTGGMGDYFSVSPFVDMISIHVSNFWITLNVQAVGGLMDFCNAILYVKNGPGSPAGYTLLDPAGVE